MNPLQTHFAVHESATSCTVSCVSDLPQKRDLNPELTNPVCEFLQENFTSQSSLFFPFPSSEPTHTRPHGALFPHFLHLLFLPLLHSLNSTLNFSHSYLACLVLWLSYSLTAIYPISSLAVFSTDSPTALLTISLCHFLSSSVLSSFSVSLLLFSWRLERVLD